MDPFRVRLNRENPIALHQHVDVFQGAFRDAIDEPSGMDRQGLGRDPRRVSQYKWPRPRWGAIDWRQHEPIAVAEQNLPGVGGPTDLIGGASRYRPWRAGRFAARRQRHDVQLPVENERKVTAVG